MLSYWLQLIASVTICTEGEFFFRFHEQEKIIIRNSDKGILANGNSSGFDTTS